MEHVVTELSLQTLFQVTASSLLGVHPDTGKIIEGTGPNINSTSVCLLRAMKKTRTDATCIMHTHQPYAAALSKYVDSLAGVFFSKEYTTEVKVGS